VATGCELCAGVPASGFAEVCGGATATFELGAALALVTGGGVEEPPVLSTGPGPPLFSAIGDEDEALTAGGGAEALVVPTTSLFPSEQAIGSKLIMTMQTLCRTMRLHTPFLGACGGKAASAMSNASLDVAQGRFVLG
jgi:hypothetical protein